MSEILGFDVDGKPLREGDECVVLSAHKCWHEIVGAVCKVTGPADEKPDVSVEIEVNEMVGDIYSKCLRRHSGQFTPADTSFHELLGQISKQGAKA